jgi:hypothetical protein
VRKIDDDGDGNAVGVLHTWDNLDEDGPRPSSPLVPEPNLYTEGRHNILVL